MPPSTSHASPRPSEAAGRFGLDALDGFYRLHAPVYDWTRPLLLRGRREAVRQLAVRPGERVLDVGCGTGFNLPRLSARGARLVGIEPSPAMRQMAERRLERHGLDSVDLDPRPYGSHAEYEASVDAILFSYSLSMIPPFEEVLERARLDLRGGGRHRGRRLPRRLGPGGFRPAPEPRAGGRRTAAVAPTQLPAPQRRAALGGPVELLPVGAGGGLSRGS